MLSPVSEGGRGCPADGLALVFLTMTGSVSCKAVEVTRGPGVLPEPRLRCLHSLFIGFVVASRRWNLEVTVVCETVPQQGLREGSPSPSPLENTEITVLASNPALPPFSCVILGKLLDLFGSSLALS